MQKISQKQSSFLKSSTSVIAASIAAAGLFVGSAAFAADETVEKTYNIKGFTEVTSEVYGDVTVETGKKFAVTGTMTEAFAKYILVEKRGKQLVLSWDKDAAKEDHEKGVFDVPGIFMHKRSSGYSIKIISDNAFDPVQLHVTMPTLEGVTVKSAGNFLVDKANGENFDAVIKGSGNIEIGEIVAKSSDASIKGSGNIVVGPWSSDKIDIAIKGSGDISVKEVTADILDVEIAGSGEISLDEAKVEIADLDIKGSGEVGLSGRCDTITVDVMGSGDVNAKSFKCDHGDIDVNGSGRVSVYTKKSIKVDRGGSGNVYIYGDPKERDVDNHRRSGISFK